MTIGYVAGWIACSLIGATLAIGGGYALMQARVLPFDRRVRQDRGRFDLPLWSGSCAAAVPVMVRLQPGAVFGMAAGAMRDMGATDVVALDLWTVAGWEGPNWRSLGQQVGVVIESAGADEVTLWCCSRPRLTTTLLDWGASQRRAHALAERLSERVAAS